MSKFPVDATAKSDLRLFPDEGLLFVDFKIYKVYFNS